MNHGVVVVGGGIVGLSAAYELAIRGADVAVIDRGPIGAGCSSGSAGHIVPSHVIPLAAPGAVRHAVSSMLDPRGAVSVRWRMGPQLWRWLRAFARNSTEAGLDDKAYALADLGGLSVDLLDSWIVDNAIECHRRTDGLLDVYGEEKALTAAATSARMAADHGVRVEVLDREAVRSIEPSLTDNVVGAVRYPDDGNLDPDAFLAGLRRAAEAAGAALLPSTELIGFLPDDRRLRTLETTAGPISADRVVLATGAWSGGLGAVLGEPIPIVSGRGMSLTADAPVKGPSHPMLLGEKHVAVGPMGGRLRLSGRFEVGEFDTNPDPVWIRRIEELARSRIDMDERLVVRETWAGLRPVAPDGMPIISRSSVWDNLTIATGHAMIGISLGPGTGRIVAQLVTGEPPEIDIAPFAITRFT